MDLPKVNWRLCRDPRSRQLKPNRKRIRHYETLSASYGPNNHPKSFCGGGQQLGRDRSASRARSSSARAPQRPEVRRISIPPGRLRRRECGFLERMGRGLTIGLPRLRGRLAPPTPFQRMQKRRAKTPNEALGSLKCNPNFGTAGNKEAGTALLRHTLDKGSQDVWGPSTSSQKVPPDVCGPSASSPPASACQTRSPIVPFALSPDGGGQPTPSHSLSGGPPTGPAFKLGPSGKPPCRREQTRPSQGGQIQESQALTQSPPCTPTLTGSQRLNIRQAPL
jgi:hypothetical protein